MFTLVLWNAPEGAALLDYLSAMRRFNGDVSPTTVGSELLKLKQLWKYWIVYKLDRSFRNCYRNCVHFKSGGIKYRLTTCSKYLLYCLLKLGDPVRLATMQWTKTAELRLRYSSGFRWDIILQLLASASISVIDITVPSGQSRYQVKMSKLVSSSS